MAVKSSLGDLLRWSMYCVLLYVRALVNLSFRLLRLGVVLKISGYEHLRFPSLLMPRSCESDCTATVQNTSTMRVFNDLQSLK